MFSKRELEGYVEIDHRESPGISPEQAARAGRGTIAVPAGKRFQSPWVKCSHCHVTVVLNPDRSRSRGYCPKCDAYVCDLCEAERVKTGLCFPFQKVIDVFREAAITGKLPIVPAKFMPQETKHGT